MEKNKNNPSKISKEKVEIANRIAEQSKKATNIYAGVEELILRFVRFISTIVDNVVFSKNLMPFVALLLAVFLYISVNINSENSIFKTQMSSAKTLTNVPVSARYNLETFEVSGLPETCEVVITGEATNVNNAASKNGTCLANLEGYTEGTHSIKLVATGFGDSVNSVVTPSDAMVTLKRKTTGQFEVDYDFVNLDKLDSKYILGTPTFLDGNRVNIRASQDTLNSIAFVKVLIDVEGVNSDFEKEATLVAYDKNGGVVNADIIPNTMKVKVPVTSPHKTVPIVLDITGEVPNNMAIDSISTDHQTTTIYAPESVLSTIDKVTVKVDASSLTRDTQMAAPITLPEGVSSADITTVSLNAKLGEAKSVTLTDVPINYKNNNKNYSLAIENNQTKINVDIIGTEANIGTIKVEDLFVFIDIEGLEPGTYDIPLKIQSNSSNSFFKYKLNKQTLKVTIIDENS